MQKYIMSMCDRLTPKSVLWIHGICEYATLHGKSVFANVVNQKILKWEHFPGL